MKLTDNYYECPECGDDVLVHEEDKTVVCNECHTELGVDRDAEYDNERWKDLTHLYRL